jgi:hypothetical protein
VPTPFRVGVGGRATIAAAGLAAAELWELRTGRRQQVAVDVRQATASLRSGTYMKLGDGELAHAAHSIMGTYPDQGRALELPPLQLPQSSRRGAQGAGRRARRTAPRWRGRWRRGTPPTSKRRLSPTRALAAWSRSAAEWNSHPQAAAIAALPVMEIVKIADSPPEPLPAGDRPLHGIRVVDITRVLAGPTCARTLAEHGAEVMKITASHLPNLGYQEWDTGHGKLSAQLDLRDPEQLRQLRDLVGQADVFSQGYRPGSLGARGLAPEELAKLRPGLVYVSLSHSGTRDRGRRGAASTRWCRRERHHPRPGRAVPGKEAGPAILPPVGDRLLHRLPDGDGAMIALARRAREGGSWLVRISLAQSANGCRSRRGAGGRADRMWRPEFTQEDLARGRW